MQPMRMMNNEKTIILTIQNELTMEYCTKHIMPLLNKDKINKDVVSCSRGTRDHIANMKWIMERQLEYGQESHICFIFDCINHELLWKTLLEMGIPKHLIQLLQGLYEDQSAVIRTEFGDTDRFKIKKGVKQGCILSPFLFNLYAHGTWWHIG